MQPNQNGPYNPEILNLEAADEPFPVKASLRGEEYKRMILQATERAAVLEEARLNRR
jgi:hypothetical protein